MNRNSTLFLMVVALLLCGYASVEAAEWSWGPFTFAFEAKVELPRATETAPPVYRTEGVYVSYGYGGTATSGGPTGSWRGPGVRDGKIVVDVNEKVGPPRRR